MYITKENFWEKFLHCTAYWRDMGIILDFEPIVPRDLSGQAHKILHNKKKMLSLRPDPICLAKFPAKSQVSHITRCCGPEATQRPKESLAKVTKHNRHTVQDDAHITPIRTRSWTSSMLKNHGNIWHGATTGNRSYHSTLGFTHANYYVRMNAVLITLS